MPKSHVQFIAFSQSEYKESIHINKQNITSIPEASFMAPPRLTMILTSNVTDKFCLFWDFMCIESYNLHYFISSSFLFSIMSRDLSTLWCVLFICSFSCRVFHYVNFSQCIFFSTVDRHLDCVQIWSVRTELL